MSPPRVTQYSIIYSLLITSIYAGIFQFSLHVLPILCCFILTMSEPWSPHLQTGESSSASQGCRTSCQSGDSRTVPSAGDAADTELPPPPFHRSASRHIGEQSHVLAHAERCQTCAWSSCNAHCQGHGMWQHGCAGLGG